MLNKYEVKDILEIIEMKKTMSDEEIIEKLFPPERSMQDLYMGR